MENSLRVHHFEPLSYSNGPGRRAVLWLQGCTLNCTGCFNPSTHAFSGGKPVLISELLKKLLRIHPKIEGLTISGGEPLQQLKPLLSFLTQIRNETSLSIVVFSGFTFEEIRAMPQSDRLIYLVDVLIAGRYDHTVPSSNPWIGSGNKTIHFFTSRYSMNDLQSVPSAEVIIQPNGEIISSGIHPLVLR